MYVFDLWPSFFATHRVTVHSIYFTFRAILTCSCVGRPQHKLTCTHNKVCQFLYCLPPVLKGADVQLVLFIETRNQLYVAIHVCLYKTINERMQNEGNCSTNKSIILNTRMEKDCKQTTIMFFETKTG